MSHKSCFYKQSILTCCDTHYQTVASVLHWLRSNLEYENLDRRQMKWSNTFSVIDRLTKGVGQNDLSMGKNWHKELLIEKRERDRGQWVWLWDLSEVINTGVLHGGVFPLCVYTVRQSKDQPLCSCTGAVSQRRAALQEVSHTHTHTYTSRYALPNWLSIFKNIIFKIFYYRNPLASMGCCCISYISISIKLCWPCYQFLALSHVSMVIFNVQCFWE